MFNDFIALNISSRLEITEKIEKLLTKLPTKINLL